MNQKELQQLSYFPRVALDEIVNAKFPDWDVQCKSEFTLLNGYITTWNPSLTPEQHAQVKAFVEGFSAGNLELRERMHDKSKWIG